MQITKNRGVKYHKLRFEMAIIARKLCETSNRSRFVDNIFVMPLRMFCKKDVKMYLCRRVMCRNILTLP